MEGKEYIKNIERKIRELAKDYENQGYEVYVYPNQSQLPQFLKGFEPDIIAKRKDDNVLIEVKSRIERTKLHVFEVLAEEISKRENWRFELVFTNPKEETIKTEKDNTLNSTEIDNRISEIRRLIQFQSYEAGFLLSWSTIEAILRLKLNNENRETFRKATSTVIKTVFSLGLLNQHDYKLIQKYSQVRSSLIHGFQERIDEKIVEEILGLILNLSGKNKELELLEWLNTIDLDHYEEIYSLYRAVSDKDNYGFFKVEELDNKIVLKAGHIEEALEFQSDSELQKFAELIEEEYMDGMEAEGWYGFQRAMEKDD